MRSSRPMLRSSKRSRRLRTSSRRRTSRRRSRCKENSVRDLALLRSGKRTLTRPLPADLKDMQLQDLRRRNESLETACLDYEGTISQFREVVITLQRSVHSSNLLVLSQTFDSIQRPRAATRAPGFAGRRVAGAVEPVASDAQLEPEAAVVCPQEPSQGDRPRTPQTRSATGVRAPRHCQGGRQSIPSPQKADPSALLQPYLLPSFFESDSDAVEALLFFERVAYKVDLLNTFIEQNHAVGDALDGVVPENLAGVCEVRLDSFILRYSC